MLSLGISGRLVSKMKILLILLIFVLGMTSASLNTKVVWASETWNLSTKV
jgi:hypothetical protein